MRIRVSKAAERELDNLFVYWAERAGVEAADRLIDSIEERFVALGEFPGAGRNSDEIAPGVFRFPAGNYLIYYRKVKSMVHVLHVIHGARDQAHAFRRD
jgi:plasmid stabilization system protein ParE